MDFNQVRYFLALSDTLNFTRAAEKCFVTQPALTQGIKRLEDELGGELVRRDGRFTELTELGKALRSHFEQIDRTRHLVRMTAKSVTSGEVAELNIGLMCTLGPRLLAGLLDSFQVQNPMTSLVLHDVKPESIPEMLLTGALDGVFCSRRGAPHPKLDYVPLFQEPMVVAFPNQHEFCQRDDIPLADLATHRYIDRLHCEFREEFIDHYEEHDLKLDVVFRSEREDWIQSLVRDGLGITVLPRYSLLHPELNYRPIKEPIVLREVEFAVAAESKASPALGKLMDQALGYEWPVIESEADTKAHTAS